MSWDWDKLKRNIVEEHQKKKKSSVEQFIEFVPIMVVIAAVSLFLGLFLLSGLLRSSTRVDGMQKIGAYFIQVIEVRDKLIEELAIANQSNSRTHALLKKYGLKLGADNKIYYLESERKPDNGGNRIQPWVIEWENIK